MINQDTGYTEHKTQNGDKQTKTQHRKLYTCIYKWRVDPIT